MYYYYCNSIFNRQSRFADLNSLLLYFNAKPPLTCFKICHVKGKFIQFGSKERENYLEMANRNNAFIHNVFVNKKRFPLLQNFFSCIRLGNHRQPTSSLRFYYIIHEDEPSHCLIHFVLKVNIFIKKFEMTIF